MKSRAIGIIFVLVLASSPVMFVFQNCSKAKLSVTDSASTQQTSGQSFCIENSTDPLCVKAPPIVTSCSFNSQTYMNGQTIVAYQNSTVEFGQQCVSEIRECKSGQMSGSYNFESCAVAAPASCQLFGSELKSGESKTAYQNSSVPFGSSCVSEVRGCTNGVVSGSYSFSSCTVGAPADCLFNGAQVKHGDFVTAFLRSSEPFGTSCNSEKRQCLNGNLTNNYSFSSCTVGAPASCLFNGASVAHGQVVSAFRESSVAFNETCTAENRTCVDGQLSGSFLNSSCAPGAPKACLFNGKSIAHGEVVTAAKVDLISGASAEICQYENRTCNNGVLSGSYLFDTCKKSTLDIANICESIGTVTGDMRIDLKKLSNVSSVLEFGTFADNYWLGDKKLGQFYDREMSFNLNDKSNIVEFILNNVAFDDWMRLKINGTIVYIGPRDGDRLELLNGSVQYGPTSFSPPELSTSWNIQLNKELNSYLVNGKNTIEMRTIVAGAGEGALRISIKTNCP